MIPQCNTERESRLSVVRQVRVSPDLGQMIDAAAERARQRLGISRLSTGEWMRTVLTREARRTLGLGRADAS